MRLVTFCAAALVLAGCADTSVNAPALSGSGASPRPKTIVVSDFVVSSDLVMLDRSFTSRLERKIGAFPTHERKTRTVERVNDEIVAAMVATLREAGLDAQPGSPEALSLADNAVVVSGRMRAANPAAKKNEAGIGGGHKGVVADMTLSSLSSFGKKPLLTFVAEPGAERKRAGGAKATAAANAEIAAALADTKAAPEKLSSDVETAARGIGRSAGEQIVAYARTHGWLQKPEGGGSEGGKADEKASDKVESTGEKSQTVKLPAVKPKKQPVG